MIDQPYWKPLHKYGCVPSCLSLLMNRSYTSVVDEYFSDYDLNKYGVDNITEQNILEDSGFEIRIVRKRWNLTVPSLLTVQSLNEPSSWHCVWWDGDDLIDPNQYVPGRQIYSKIFLLTHLHYLSYTVQIIKFP